MNVERFAEFSVAYRNGLLKGMKDFPESYITNRTPESPEVMADMVSAKILNTMAERPLGVNYANSHGFKNACKTLGIKYTRKSIFEYLEIT